MAHVRATDRPLAWAVGTPIVASGTLQAGDLLLTGLALYANEDENALLGALATAGVTALPLPDVGAELEQGEIYDYNGTLVMVRKDTVRVPGDPLLQVSEFGVYREGAEAFEWVAGEIVSVGAQRTYEGVLYELYRDIGANNWSPPPEVAAHWRAVVEDEWPEWVQPTGAHDAYQKGDKVTFEGGHYISLIDANVWSPAVYPQGWEYKGPA